MLQASGLWPPALSRYLSQPSPGQPCLIQARRLWTQSQKPQFHAHAPAHTKSLANLLYVCMYMHICCCLMPDFFYSAGIQPVSHIPRGGGGGAGGGDIGILSSLSITKTWTDRGALDQCRYCTLRVRRSRESSSIDVLTLEEVGLFFLLEISFLKCCVVSRLILPLSRSSGLSGWRSFCTLIHSLQRGARSSVDALTLNVLTVVLLMRLTGIEIPSEHHYLLEIV